MFSHFFQAGIAGIGSDKYLVIVIGHWQPKFLLLHLKEQEKISRLAV